MAGTDMQKQPLPLIGDFTTENSRGEQTIVELTKRIEVLQSEVEAANTEIEDAKRIKEATEHDLNGHEVELACSETMFQSLEVEKPLLGGTKKNEEGLFEDPNKNQMPKQYKGRRMFLAAVTCSIDDDESTETTAASLPVDTVVSEDDIGISSEDLEDVQADIHSPISKVEEESLAENDMQNQATNREKQEKDYMHPPVHIVETFDGKNNFTLWQEKITAYLQTLGLDEALQGEAKMPATLSDVEKAVIQQRARSIIILSLSDQVLKSVMKEETAAKMWLKLEEQYMNRSFSTRMGLKERFYCFKMDEHKSMEDNVNDFKKLVSDLENTGVEVKDEDQATRLLNSLPRQFRQLHCSLIDAHLYTTDKITLEEVLSAVYSKDMELRANGRLHAIEGVGLKKRGRRKQACWTCRKEGHLKRDCPTRKRQILNRAIST